MLGAKGIQGLGNPFESCSLTGEVFKTWRREDGQQWAAATPFFAVAIVVDTGTGGKVEKPQRVAQDPTKAATTQSLLHMDLRSL